jgi:hypothetical protein
MRGASQSTHIKTKTMKKQEMINVIMLEERKLWNDLQECLEKLGANDPITESATTRWATINKLVKSLGL